jgi:hypothetical protein
MRWGIPHHQNDPLSTSPLVSQATRSVSAQERKVDRLLPVRPSSDPRRQTFKFGQESGLVVSKTLDRAIWKISRSSVGAHWEILVLSHGHANAVGRVRGLEESVNDVDGGVFDCLDVVPPSTRSCRSARQSLPGWTSRLTGPEQKDPQAALSAKRRHSCNPSHTERPRPGDAWP